MTAEEYLEKNDNKYDFTSVGTMGITENPDGILQFANDYLNSQRETIFKEELEKRLPSEEVMLNEIGSQYRQGDMMVGPIDSDEMSKMTAYLWLIQYLKK